jgi:hypothetical protein
MTILADKTNPASVLASDEFLNWFLGLSGFACDVNGEF